jgi:hypothetical protein
MSAVADALPAVRLEDHRLPPEAADLVAKLRAAVRAGDERRAGHFAFAIGIEFEKLDGRNAGAEAILAAASQDVEAMRLADLAIERNRAACDLLSVALIRADAVAVEPIRWLWRDWLARGKFHLIAGAPSAGKTTTALALIAAITSGGRLPDGTRAQRAPCIIWSGEDDPADTLVPRLLAMGADLSMVHFVGPVTEDGCPRPFDPATDVPLLRERLADVPGVALLMLDPIVVAVLGDSHRNAETRRGLQPLADLGHALDVAVVGITHFTKGTAMRDPVERVTGSLAFGAIARIVMVAARRTEEAGGGRFLARAKSNIGPDGSGFVFDVQPVELRPGIVTTRLLWGARIEGEARELLAASATDSTMTESSDRHAAEDAAAWLAELLAEDEMAAPEVKKHAADAGFAWRTVQRAMKTAGVVSARTGFGPAAKYVWKLAHVRQSPSCAPSAPNKRVGAHGAHGADEAAEPGEVVV